MNDPVNATDPTGMCPNCVTGGIGAAIGGLFGGGSALISELTDDNPGVRHGRVARGAAKGAIVGGVIGATGNVALGTGAAALLGGADGAYSAHQEGGGAIDVVAGGAAGAVVDSAAALAGGGAGKLIGNALGDTVGGAIGAELAGNTVGAMGATGAQAVASAIPQLSNAVTSGISDLASQAPGAFNQAAQEIQSIGEDPPQACRPSGEQC